MSTLDEIRKKAKDGGVYHAISQDDWNRITDFGDLERLVDYTLDYSKAGSDAGRALASAGAENIRARYGYSLKNGRATELGQDYSGDEFSFDPARSSRYRAAVKSYEAGGKRAAEEAIASASQATGGIPSSYAVTAATEAGSRYRAGLTEALSDIYDDEYDNFIARKNEKIAQAQKEAADAEKKAAAQAESDRKAAEAEHLSAQRKLYEYQIEQLKNQLKEARKDSDSDDSDSENIKTKKGTAGRLYTDPERTALNGSQPVAYYANIMLKMLQRGATNDQIRAYLSTIISDEDGLTMSDRQMLIPYFWNLGSKES